MKKSSARIAVNRFGLGARPGEIDRIGNDGKAWLNAQLSSKAVAKFPLQALRPSKDIVLEMLSLRDKKRRTEKALKLLPVFKKVYFQEVETRLAHSVTTPDGFYERLVRFWSNHFTVAVRKFQTYGLAGAFEREAVRPNIMGSFEDLLVSVMQHPAMLFYLDNAQSFGPNSKAGKRRKKGLNENLAREALELHTLGVDGGYSQKDVEELAKALTGWTVNTFKIQPGTRGEFRFVGRLHEPGKRTVLRKTYAEGGEIQAREIFKDLARHPATAKYIAHKLARHFISDTPSQKSITALERAFLSSNGNLKQVYKTLINLDEAWRGLDDKFKTPEEFIISTFRGIDVEIPINRDLQKTYQTLGQIPFGAPSPQGWSDLAVDWSGPDAVKKRIEWAQAVATKYGSIQPEKFYSTAFGSAANGPARQAIQRADSREQGVILALMSPEFQRR